MTAPTRGARASRRTILGSGASLLLLSAAAAGQAKAEELDGELLALAQDFHRVYAEGNRALAYAIDLPEGHPEWHSSMQAASALFREESTVLHCMGGLPARTPEGLQAKAGALAARASEATGFTGDSGISRLAASLLADLIGRRA